MSAIPIEHITDSQKLTADAEIDLFELTPVGSSAVIYFKADNPVDWQGHTYEALPIQFVGFEKSTDGSAIMPKLTVGDGTTNLSPFKPLVYDGNLDGAIVRHRKVLLDNVLNNRNIHETMTYRVKRIPGYSSLQIELQLATASDALGYTLPNRQYFPPAFPAVQQ